MATDGLVGLDDKLGLELLVYTPRGVDVALHQAEHRLVMRASDLERASDRDRERVVALLRERCVEGYLSVDRWLACSCCPATSSSSGTARWRSSGPG